ncbi:hypothetical protein O9993_06185 [Vibrio lentus]|nr:hypothetical protein [Vibrio lentus]
MTFSEALTFGGVGGLIVGLAAELLRWHDDSDRPFKVGIGCASPRLRQIEGTVERIGWRVIHHSHL